MDFQEGESRLFCRYDRENPILRTLRMTMLKSMQSITRFIVVPLTANLYGIYYNKTKFKELELEETEDF